MESQVNDFLLVLPLFLLQLQNTVAQIKQKNTREKLHFNLVGKRPFLVATFLFKKSTLFISLTVDYIFYNS